jgi:hypothetical protein
MCSLLPGRNKTWVDFSWEELDMRMSHVSPGEVHTCAISPQEKSALVGVFPGGSDHMFYFPRGEMPILMSHVG